MPLKSGKKNFGRNVAELERAGHKPSQALAIAYKTEGKDTESAREEDINGFTEIQGNPISKVGVFEYSGQQISPDLEPNRIYKVFRSEEALNNEETINSFRLLPWTDDHTMLSGKPEDGLTDPARKGVHGIIGENVYFEAPYLKANVKIFSAQLAKLINSGKQELSIGYRCVYEAKNGEYDGEQYEFLQKNIMGNHLALVDEGRSGHDVAVLDHFKFTLDSKDLKMAEKKGDMEKPEDAKDEGEMSMKEMCSMMRRMAEKLEGMDMDAAKDEFEDDVEAEKINGSENLDDVDLGKFVERANGIDSDEDKEKETEDEEETEKKAEEEGDAKDEYEEKKEGAMDEKLMTKRIMAQISTRDALAKRLSVHIGTFDHSQKTVEEVAVYGVKKLGLRCSPKNAVHVLDGYLAGARPSRVAMAEDSKRPSTSIDAYLAGEK
jgi:hypothetical protein